MSGFKAGDLVRRTGVSVGGVVRGETYKVASVSNNGSLQVVSLLGVEDLFTAGGFELATGGEHQFKIGDRVVRTGPDYHGVRRGDRYVVSGVSSRTLRLEGHSFPFSKENFRLAPADAKDIFAGSTVLVQFEVEVKSLDTLGGAHIVKTRDRVYRVPESATLTVVQGPPAKTLREKIEAVLIDPDVDPSTDLDRVMEVIDKHEQF